MPKRKKEFSRSQAVSKRQKIARNNESAEETEARLTMLRQNYHQNIINQTEEQLKDSRETDRIRKRLQRKRETDTQAHDRREQNKERMRNYRLNEQVEAQILETTVHDLREKRQGS